MNVRRLWPVVAIAILSTFLVLVAQGPYVPSGIFNADSAMSIAREGPSSAVLLDGRILISGGKDASGNALYSAEILGGSSAGQMYAPRAGHISVTLKDGTVLVAGGSTSGSASTNATEVYNPYANTWTVAAHSMLEARIGATATLLDDGRVLIAGGDNGSGPLQTTEIYDPASGSFASGPALSSARKKHASALLHDGRVVIAGGSNGSSVLATIDVYNPLTNTVSALAPMATARQSLSATTLLRGQVLLSGGNNGSSDLAGTEILDVTAGSIMPGPSMSTARSGHLALLLPNNNTILMVSGAASGAAEIFVPWQNAFTPFGTLAAARMNAGGGASPLAGSASIAGGAVSGTASNAVETIHFPTVKTDKDDYSPGTTVYITGSGFQPGETVALTLDEEPHLDTHTILPVVADANGNIASSEFAPDEEDLGIRFYLTATGGTSGLTAGTTFTDANDNTSMTVSCSPNPISVGSATTCTAQVNNIESGAPHGFPQGTVKFSLTGLTGVFSPSDTCTLARIGSTVNSSCSVTYTPNAAASGTVKGQYNASTNDWNNSNNTVNVTVNANAATTTSVSASPISPTTYGTSVLFTATVTPSSISCGTVDFKDGAVTIASGRPVSSGIASFSTSTLAVATHSITAVYAPAPSGCSFTGSTSAALSYVVNKKSLTVTGITVNNKIYDGNTTATINTASATLVGVVSGEAVTLDTSSYTANFDNKNVGTAKAVTVSGLALSGTNAGNYTLTQPIGLTANVTAKPLTVTGITVNNKVYDGSTTATLNTTSATLVGVVSGDAVTLDTSSPVANFNNKNVGTGKAVTVSGLAVSGTGASNYTLTQPTGLTANITAKTLTVTGITASNKVYDGATTATIDSSSAALVGVVLGDTVTLDKTAATGAFANRSVGTGKTVTISGLTLSGTDAGNYTVTQPTTAADITPKNLTVSGITANNKIYDGNTTAALNVGTAALVGKVSGDDVTLNTGSAAGAFADKIVGTGKAVTVSGLTITGTDAGNYTLTQPTTTADITPKALTVSGVTANNKIYDGNTAAALNTGTAALVGVVSGDIVNLSTGTAAGAFADKTVGTGKAVTVSGLTISGTDAGNYTLTQPSTTANITPKNLTVSGVTASNKVYDGNTTAVLNLGTAAPVGKVSGDDVTLNTGSAAGVFADKIVGTGKAVTVSGLTITGADAGNYTLTLPTGVTADITAKPLTGSITASDKVYDGNTTATIATRTLSGVVGLDAVSFTGGSATFIDKHVGTGKAVNATGLTLSGADAGNYSVNSTAATTASITQRPLTVTATGVNKVYDGNANATVTLSDDRVSGDVFSDSYTSAAFSDKNVANSKTVTVNGISISGADAGNYSFNATTTTTANITAKPLTVSATGVNKVYDGNASATVTLSDDRVAGDVFTHSYASAAFANKNVGNGKTVSVTGISISGTDAGNYSFNTTATTTANITPLGITVTAVTSSKTYDGNTSSTGIPTIAPALVGGDTASFTQTFDTRNAGTGKTLAAAGSVNDGNSGNNYTVTFATVNTGVINALSITVTAVTQTRIYDGTSTSTGVPTIAPALISPDTSNFTQAFDSKNAGSRTLTPTGSVSDGNSGNNYTVHFTSVGGTITQRPLAVTATGVNKVYDGNANATVTLSDDRVSGDVFSDSYTSAAFSDKNVANSKTVTVNGISIGGADAGNYSFNATTTTTANITARPLTVSATGVNKVYDGTATATVTLSDDRVAGDVFTHSYASAAFANKNVGNGKTVSVTGISISGTDAGNYSFNTTASTSANITPLAITVTAVTSTKTYDGNTSSTGTPTIAPALVGGDTASFTQTFDTRNAGTGKTLMAVGSVNDGNSGNNYSVTFATVNTGVINPLSITVTAVTQTRIYDGTSTSTGVPTIAPAPISPDGSNFAQAFDSKNVGSRTLTPAGSVSDGNGGNNYTVHFTSVGGTITQRPLAVSATGVNKVYDGNANATVTLSDDRISGDVFSDSYASAAFSDKNVANGKTVNVSGIAISGADAGNYSFNATTTTTANITAKPLTVSATGVNKVYDGNASATVTLSDDRVVGDVFNDSYASAAFGNKNAGNGKTVSVNGISISGTDAGNYSFNTTATTTANITPLGITVTAVTSSKTYDGNTSSTGIPTIAPALVGGDTASFTQTFDTRNAGTGKTLTAAGSVNDGNSGNNYSVTLATVNTGVINPLSITVTAVTQTRIYDGTSTSTGVPTIAPALISPDASNFTQAFDSKNVGSRTLTPTGLVSDGNSGNNYTVHFTSVGGTITQRPLAVTATGVNKVYDGNANATVTLSDDRISGDVFSDSYTGAAFSDKNVANGKTVSVSGISITGMDAGNYSFNTATTTTANITAKPLTVSATGLNKVYDGNASATVTLSDDRVAGDVFTDSYASAAFVNKNAGNGKTVNVSGISISGTDAGNYSFNTSASTSANITPLGITGSITAQNKTYDGTTAATIATYSLSGAISGDSVSYVGGTATFSDKNVANGKTVTALGLSLSGADAGNYTVNTTATALANITPQPLSITADSKTKLYGAPLPVFTANYLGFVPGEGSGVLAGTLNCTTTPLATALSNIGTYTINCNGQTSTNYAIGYSPGTLTINTVSTTTILSSGINISTTPVGITLQAVVASSTVTPLGSVTFTDTTTSTMLGTITLSSGQATLTTTSLGVGPHVISATYIPANANFGASGSGANAAPGVTITSPSTGTVQAVNTPYNLTGTFTDTASQTHTAAWSVDTASISGNVTETNGSGSISGSYTPTTAGVYGIKLTVNDGVGGITIANTVSSANAPPNLSAQIVVYDPSAGFVTGGGWIDSPAGAYNPNPALTGKATFGFVSKYQKGATIPTGETEFNYNVANFNFHSTIYQWLVISGPMAQYKGTGTINGSGSYNFLLTGRDGKLAGGNTADGFRIKITNPTTGAVIYDNLLSADETMTSSNVQALGGGSIVVHKN